MMPIELQLAVGFVGGYTILVLSNPGRRMKRSSIVKALMVLLAAPVALVAQEGAMPARAK